MLADSVAAALRAAISEGEYMPGQQLNEVRASERFDCSRNTLRESFAMLAAERIVERIPHRGVFIATPDEDFVRDLYLARAAIEPAAARYGTFPDPGELVSLTESAVLSDAPRPSSTSASTSSSSRAWAPRPWTAPCPTFSPACG